MEWGLFWAYLNIMLMLKIDPWWSLFFDWPLMIIGEEAPDFLKEWLFVGRHFGRSIVPW